MEMQAVMIASQLISMTDDFTVKVFIFADHQVDVSTFKNIFFCRQSKTTEFKHSSTEKLPCLLKTQRYPGLPQLLCLLPHQNVVPSGPSATGQSTSSKSTSIPETSATAKTISDSCPSRQIEIKSLCDFRIVHHIRYFGTFCCKRAIMHIEDFHQLRSSRDNKIFGKVTTFGDTIASS
jgi:hypothetical protein